LCGQNRPSAALDRRSFAKPGAAQVHAKQILEMHTLPEGPETAETRMSQAERPRSHFQTLIENQPIHD
jgi:hypothetical protein